MEQSVQAVIFVPILNCCKKRMELFKESQSSSLQAASIDLPHVCGYVLKLLCYIWRSRWKKNYCDIVKVLKILNNRGNCIS